MHQYDNGTRFFENKVVNKINKTIDSAFIKLASGARIKSYVKAKGYMKSFAFDYAATNLPDFRNDGDQSTVIVLLGTTCTSGVETAFEKLQSTSHPAWWMVFRV